MKNMTGYKLFEMRDDGKLFPLFKVIRILSEDERQKILKEANYDEAEAFEPYKRAMEKRIKAI